MPRETNLWLRRYHRPHDDAPRLVCFPHAGGSASYYRILSEACAPHIEVLAVQYPARQDRHRDEPLESITKLADSIYEAMVLAGGRPTALFGHSMGATVAFEVGRRLTSEAQSSLTGLFISSRKAPSLCEGEEFSNRSDDQILTEMRSLGGTSELLINDPEMRLSILTALRADYKALDSYKFQESFPLSCPIVGLIGNKDPRVTINDVTAWKNHTKHEFELHTFRGGHFYLNDNIYLVSDLIKDKLLVGAGGF